MNKGEREQSSRKEEQIVMSASQAVLACSDSKYMKEVGGNSSVDRCCK